MKCASYCLSTEKKKTNFELTFRKQFYLKLGPFEFLEASNCTTIRPCHYFSFNTLNKEASLKMFLEPPTEKGQMGTNR